MAEQIDQAYGRFHRGYLSRVRQVAAWLSIAHMIGIPPYRRLIGTRIKRAMIWSLANHECYNETTTIKDSEDEEKCEQLAMMADSLVELTKAIDRVVGYPYELYCRVMGCSGQESSPISRILTLLLAGDLYIPRAELHPKNNEYKEKAGIHTSKIEPNYLIKYLEILYRIHTQPEEGFTYTCNLVRTFIKVKPGIEEHNIKQLCNFSITDSVIECRDRVEDPPKIAIWHMILYPRRGRTTYIKKYLEKIIKFEDNDSNECINKIINKIENIIKQYDSLENRINLITYFLKYKFTGSMLGIMTTTYHIMNELKQKLETLQCILEKDHKSPTTTPCRNLKISMEDITNISPSIIIRDIIGILNDLILTIEAFYASILLPITTDIYYHYLEQPGSAKYQLKFYTTANETYIFQVPSIPCCLFKLEYFKDVENKHTPSEYFSLQFLQYYFKILYNKMLQELETPNFSPKSNLNPRIKNLDLEKILVTINQFIYLESETSPSAHLADLLGKFYEDIRSGKATVMVDIQEKAIGHNIDLLNNIYAMSYLSQLMLDSVMSLLNITVNQGIRRQLMKTILRNILEKLYLKIAIKTSHSSYTRWERDYELEILLGILHYIWIYNTITPKIKLLEYKYTKLKEIKEDSSNNIINEITPLIHINYIINELNNIKERILLLS
ncbi:MAG: hypothetical protein GXO43_02670, partial [Crenarchaeota archaeon]|nr:hypothetical protein [Thermoproteota archaeon]